MSLSSAGQAAGEAVDAVLPSGTVVRVRLAEGAREGIGSVGRDRGEAPASLREALAPIGEVATLVRERLEQVRATRASVEFGVSLSAESGPLTALLFTTKGEASIVVRLEWERDA